ncbi:MAG: YtxH domain-containing protein [Actinomycetota bacterium]
MRLKLGFLVGFGAGYVLGAKAGHDRYEQLRRLYGNLISSPQFQEASGKAREAVGTGFEQAKGAATEGVSKVKGAVSERRDEDTRPGGLSVAPPSG